MLFTGPIGVQFEMTKYSEISHCFKKKKQKPKSLTTQYI